MYNRKFLYITFLVLVLTTSAFAQQVKGKGFKLGLNVASITGEDVEDPEPKAGFVGGAYITIEMNDVFSIQPELLFSMKGAYFEDKDYYGDEYIKVEEKDTFYYLEVPVLARFDINAHNDLKPSLFFGPALSFNMSAKYDMDIEMYTHDYGLEKGSTDGDIDDFSAIDFSLVFGAGIQFNRFIIDARYDIGLADIVEDKDIKNLAFSIMAGIEL